MSLEHFQKQKAKFTEQEQKVIKAKEALAKNSNILEALSNELNALLARGKAKLAEQGAFSADEYVELKQQDAGYKARLEYYNALQDELTEAVYQAQRELAEQQTALNRIRSQFLTQQAETLLTQILAQHKDELAQIYCYLDRNTAGKFEPTDYTDQTKKELILQFIGEKVGNSIDLHRPIEAEFSTYSAELTGFTARSPAAEHRINVESANKKTGFTALLEKLAN